MINFYTILTVLWVIFIAYWFVSAFSAKKTVKTGSIRNWAILRIMYIAIIVFLVEFPGTKGWFTFNNPVVSVNPVMGWIGIILTALGIALAIWARVYLGKNWGMPMSHKENPELVTGGPYEYIRNPIYSGVLLAAIGSGLIVGTIWFVIFALMAAYFIYSSKVEEKIMLKEFPNTYPEYKKRTKMLIPFVL